MIFNNNDVTELKGGQKVPKNTVILNLCPLSGKKREKKYCCNQYIVRGFIISLWLGIDYQLDWVLVLGKHKPISSRGCFYWGNPFLRIYVCGVSNSPKRILHNCSYHIEKDKIHPLHTFGPRKLLSILLIILYTRNIKINL